MPVDSFGDKITHSSHTGRHQAVGKLIQWTDRVQLSDFNVGIRVIPVVHRLYSCYY